MKAISSPGVRSPCPCAWLCHVIYYHGDKKYISLSSGNRFNQVLLENKSALVTTVDSKLLRKAKMTLLNLQNRGQTDLEASVRYDWFSFDKVLKGSIVRNS